MRMVTALAATRVSSRAMGIESAERSFAELLAAFGDLVVARSRGAHASWRGASAQTLVRRYRARRRAIDADLDRLPDELSSEDRRAVANMRGRLSWLDQHEPTPGARPIPGSTSDEDRTIAVARATMYRRFGEVAGAIPVGSKTLDLPTIVARLATETDAGARRTMFEALLPLWRTVDGDGDDASPYLRLLRASAARWAAHGSPTSRNALSLGMPPASVEGAFQAILAEWRKVAGHEGLEPWDYWFTFGAAARRLDGRVPAKGLVGLNRGYLAALGADPAELGIIYDIGASAGRAPFAVSGTIGMGARTRNQPTGGAWMPRPPRVFATVAPGGLASLRQLLHDSGLALHRAAVRTRPAFLDWSVDDAAFLEGVADSIGWDPDEPAWQRQWLGAAAETRDAVLYRYGGVALDTAWGLFEIELHRHPDRRPNDVWTEITTYSLGIEPHPEWSWWAMRPQLVDSPGQIANRALSAIVAAAVRERVWDLQGPWWSGDPGWYRFMSDRLYSAGTSRSPADLIGALLGRPLTTGPLLDDLRRAR
jgi:hypothetical protein